MGGGISGGYPGGRGYIRGSAGAHGGYPRGPGGRAPGDPEKGPQGPRKRGSKSGQNRGFFDPDLGPRQPGGPGRTPRGRGVYISEGI